MCNCVYIYIYIHISVCVFICFYTYVAEYVHLFIVQLYKVDALRLESIVSSQRILAALHLEPGSPQGDLRGPTWSHKWRT